MRDVGLYEAPFGASYILIMIRIGLTHQVLTHRNTMMLAKSAAMGHSRDV